MPKKNPLHLQEGDRVLCAYAERVNGPGWGNSPLWVFVENRIGTIRCECLQPMEQSLTVLTLYGIAEAVHKALMDGVAKSIGSRTWSSAKIDTPDQR